MASAAEWHPGKEPSDLQPGGPPSLCGQLLDAVGQAVVAFDLRGKILHWNRAAEEMYGWAAGEVVGRPWEDIGLAED